MITTQSPSELKTLHEAITRLWQIFKKHMDDPPKTIGAWQAVIAEFDECAGRDPFKCEMAVTYIHEIQRRAGDTVTGG